MHSARINDLIFAIPKRKMITEIQVVHENIFFVEPECGTEIVPLIFRFDNAVRISLNFLIEGTITCAQRNLVKPSIHQVCKSLHVIRGIMVVIANDGSIFACRTFHVGRRKLIIVIRMIEIPRHTHF